jgi:hypothetical protein
MSHKSVSLRGLQKESEENIHSNIVQNENYEDFINEEAIPPSSIAVVHRLLEIGSELQDIWDEEDISEEEREAYFEGVNEELDELILQVQYMENQMITEEDQADYTEIDMEFAQMEDEQYLDATQLFLTAIESFRDFMATGDPDSLKTGLERVEKGTYKLENITYGSRYGPQPIIMGDTSTTS